jgi:hypothetical protein
LLPQFYQDKEETMKSTMSGTNNKPSEHSSDSSTTASVKRSGCGCGCGVKASKAAEDDVIEVEEDDFLY